MTDFLTVANCRLAYETGPGSGPGVMFLGGYRSDMSGTKATFLAERCRAPGVPYCRFDYRGHGKSEGQFKDGTISAWLGDALAVLDQATRGPQVLVGSSLGGWLAFLLALKRPERIKGCVGIAAAPDFTEDLVWEKMSAEQKTAMQRDGFITEPSAYSPEPDLYTLDLIKDGRTHLLLRKQHALKTPLRLVQGLNDRDVPPHWPARIEQAFPQADVQTTYVKDGDHRLSSADDLQLMWRTVTALL